MGGRVILANNTDRWLGYTFTHAEQANYNAGRAAPTATDVVSTQYLEATTSYSVRVESSVEGGFDAVIRRGFLDFDPPEIPGGSEVVGVSLGISPGPLLVPRVWKSKTAILGSTHNLPPVAGDFDRSRLGSLFGSVTIDYLKLPPDRAFLVQLNKRAMSEVMRCINESEEIKIALLEYDYDYNYTFGTPPPGDANQGSNFYSSRFEGGAKYLIQRPRLFVHYGTLGEGDVGRFQPHFVRIVSEHNTDLYLEYPFELLNLGGIGLPPMSNQWAGSPLAPGGVFLNRRVLPRTLDLTFAMWGRGQEQDSVWAKRQEAFRALSLLQDPLKLEIHMYNGEVFSLRDVYVDAMSDSGLSYGGTPTRHTASMRLVAMDPIWWGREYQYFIHSPEDASNSFDVEFTLVNGGTAPSYPEITVLGPCGDASFGMLPSAGYVETSGHTQGGGSFFTIQAKPLGRYVRDDADQNIALTLESVLSRMHLVPDPYSPGGVNTLIGEVEVAPSPTQLTTVQVSWADRWYGV